MRQITKKDIKHAFGDRWWLGLVMANIFLGVIVMLVIGFGIEPKETQVITHYSSFGLTGFYRSQWYTLWGYALLELIVVVAHGVLSLKLLHLDRRDLALALLWGTLGVSLLVLLFALSIIRIAALG